MANTTFVNRVTPIATDWLQDVNDFVYGAGADPGDSGFWPDVTDTTQIYRLRDRVFIGEGAAFTGNRTGTQEGFVPTSTEGANWASRDSTMFVAASGGLLAVTGFSRSSDNAGNPPWACIGVSGFVINDNTTVSGGKAWGLYSDIQHEPGAASSYGLEVAAKNKGADFTSTPYALASGVFGAWLVAGGDNSYGGSAANPSNAAVVILGGASTWNTGILFESGGLTTSSGVSNAMVMGVGMRLYWYTSGGNKAFSIRSDNDTGGASIDIVAAANSLTWIGANSKSCFSVVHTPSAVNYLSATSNTTTNAPQLKALGDDTNIDLALIPKGTGVVSYGTHSALAAETVTGYITIRDSGGTLRKLAVVS